MPPDIKFCGLTRAEDADCAAELGAAYVGVIFAGGPRLLTASERPRCWPTYRAAWAAWECSPIRRRRRSRRSLATAGARASCSCTATSIATASANSCATVDGRGLAGDSHRRRRAARRSESGRLPMRPMALLLDALRRRAQLGGTGVALPGTRWPRPLELGFAQRASSSRAGCDRKFVEGDRRARSRRRRRVVGSRVRARDQGSQSNACVPRRGRGWLNK